METKRWWKSLTIISLAVCMACLLFMPLTIAKPLKDGFTVEELSIWARSVSNNQWATFLMMIAISAALIGIYGRVRANKGIGK